MHLDQKTRVASTSAALWACLGLLVGCSREPPRAASVPDTLLRPAGVKTSAFISRLPELLPFAALEVETDQIHFTDRVDASALKEGWSLEPSLGKAWTGGGSSTLEFKVFPVREIQMSFRCAPFHYPGSAKQTLTISVNGRELERLRLWRMTRSYTVRIPREALRFGSNELELSYGYSAIPSEVVEGSEDSRSLAVLWEWIRFGDSRP